MRIGANRITGSNMFNRCVLCLSIKKVSGERRTVTSPFF